MHSIAWGGITLESAWEGMPGGDSLQRNCQNSEHGWFESHTFTPPKLPHTPQAYTNVKLPSLTTLQSLDGDNAFEQPYGLQAESGQALTVHIDHYNLVFEL